MADSPPEIDFSQLSFPSDRLTIGAIRAAQPDRFSGDGADFMEVAGLVTAERWLARKAYAAALGQPDPYGDSDMTDREGVIEGLADEYANFGLSSGINHTREMSKRTAEAILLTPARVPTSGDFGGTGQHRAGGGKPFRPLVAPASTGRIRVASEAAGPLSG